MSKKYMIKVNGKIYEVEVEEVATAETSSRLYQASEPTSAQPVQNPIFNNNNTISPEQAKTANTSNSEKNNLEEKAQPSSQAVSSEFEKIISPMSGTVLKVNVKPGDVVKDAQTLVIVEAMKMENEILAPRDGKIGEVFVKDGQQVEIDQTLLTLE